MQTLLKTQIRVVAALVLRETRTRFGKMKLGYLWAFLEPLSMVGILSAVFMAFGRKAPFGIHMLVFFASGMLAFQLYKNLSAQLSSAFSANQSLFTFPVVQRIDALYARTILEVATVLLVIIVLFGCAIMFGITGFPHDLTKIGIAIFSLTLFGFGMGSINAVLIVLLPAWRPVEAMITRPLFFLSGIFYAVDTLPLKAREALLWNPILHGVEMMRLGLFSSYRSSHVDIIYLLWWGILTTLIGLSAERAFKRRLSR